MLNDLHILHLESMTWTRPKPGGAGPGPRAGHTLTALENKLFIFAGGDDKQYLNDLHILDTEAMTWEQAYVSGTTPSARSRHSATAVGKRLLVFGGGDESRVFNDLYVLDTDAMSWSRPQSNGPVPCSRWGHTASMIDERRLLIFGGHDGRNMLGDAFILDVQTMTWSQLHAEGAPSARAGHTATLFKKNLIVFGGGDGVKIMNDLHVLDTTTLTWRRPTASSVSNGAPSGRCAHTAIILDGRLVIHGGGDGSRRYKDLYILDVASVFKQEADRERLSAPKLEISAPPDKQQHPIAPAHPQAAPLQPPAEQAKPAGDIRSVGAWLNSINMAKYAEQFAAHEIDMSMLSVLTERHLEQIGIPTLGARLRLLLKIRELGAKPDPQLEQLTASINALTQATQALHSALTVNGVAKNGALEKFALVTQALSQVRCAAELKCSAQPES